MNVLAGQIVLGIYAILLAVGGVVGYLKARSRPSLIAGFLCAALATICLAASGPRPRLGFWLGAILALGLLLFFGRRFARARKFMPSGLMTLLSLGVAATLIALRLQAVAP